MSCQNLRLIFINLYESDQNSLNLKDSYYFETILVQIVVVQCTYKPNCSRTKEIALLYVFKFI